MENLKLSIEDISKLKSNKTSEEEKIDLIKCGKPHIVSLPHDRRTNDPSKLNERLVAIDEEIAKREQRIKEQEESVKYWQDEYDKLAEENEQMENNLARMEELDQEMKDLRESLKPQINQELSDIIDEIHEALEGEDMPPVHWSGGIPRSDWNKAKYYYDDLNRLFEMTENGGLLTDFDVERLYRVAYFLDYNDAEHESGTVVDDRFYNGISDKLRSVADKYKGSEHPQVIARNQEYRELGGSPSNLERKIKDNNYWMNQYQEWISGHNKKIERNQKELDDLNSERDLTHTKFDQNSRL